LIHSTSSKTLRNTQRHGIALGTVLRVELLVGVEPDRWQPGLEVTDRRADSQHTRAISRFQAGCIVISELAVVVATQPHGPWPYVLAHRKFVPVLNTVFVIGGVVTCIDVSFKA